MADPDQDILDFYNQSHGAVSPGGSPSATMTPDPDQDILDFYNKSRSPTPSPTSAPSRSPYTDQAVQQQSASLNPPEKPGIVSTIAGSAARGFLPGRAMLAAYPYGAVAGAAGVGALRGALVGAAVPIAGETGISEAIGGVIGGLIAGGIAAWGVHKLQTKAADVVSPEGAFSSKTEQAQVAAHPYAAIVGGGLSFGKPNPMNVVRAGKTLASKEGRAALVAFTKTQGQGMDPKAVDEVGNVLNVAMAGGLNSAFNVKDQIESGHFDPEQLAVAAATGLLFNQPWFHKANPAAAAAGKSMSQFGVPTAGPSGPTAPPGIAAPEPPVPPGIVPPGVGTARSRVPGLLDFEIPPPATETARAPEAPLPEAPIPRPGTEGGITNAPQERPVTESRVEEYQRVPPGENVPENVAGEGPVSSEQAGYRGRTGAETPEQVREGQWVFDPKTQEWTQTKAETEPVTTVAGMRATEFGPRPIPDTGARSYQIEHGDTSAIVHVDPDSMRIQSIDTPQEARGRGSASTLIDNLKAESDATGKPITGDLGPEVNPGFWEKRGFNVDENGRIRYEPSQKTPYSIKEKNGLFIVEDSRDPTRVTSAPKRTLEEAQQRKAALDKTFEKNELARMQREHEAELLREAEGHQAKGGDELLDAVAQHGVPVDDPNYRGELETLKGHFAPRGKYGQEKHRKMFTGERLNWGDVFQKDAGSLDSLTRFLKEKGFDVDSIDDTIQLIDERLRSGKKVYGDEARAQALEEESFGQGPMRMAPSKEPLTWKDASERGHGRVLQTPDGKYQIALGFVGNWKGHTGKYKEIGWEILKKNVRGEWESTGGSYDSLSAAKRAATERAQEYGYEHIGYTVAERNQMSKDQGPMRTKHPFGGHEEPEPSWKQKAKEILGFEFGKSSAANVEAREAENLRNDPVKQDKVISEVVAKEPPVEKIDKTPGRRIVSTSQDEDQVDRLLGKDAYKNSIVNVVIKELLQNGFDAVREGGASELKPGQIAIDYDYATRTISVRDNGVGMDPETIVTAFLRTGGTKKSGDYQNTSGGLGVAKIAFLKGSKRIKLVTVKDGLKTVMDVDQAQIKAKQIPLDSTYTNEPNGTTVTVEIPDKYVDLNGETQDVWFDTDPDFLKNPLFGPVEVTINGERAPMGLHTEGWQKDNRFNFRWGHADVWVDPRPLGKYSWGEDRDPVYSVMSAGLHQFDISWGKIFNKADDRIPHNIVIDVRPHVDTKSPDYPFNNQREGWRGNVERDAAAMYAFLKRQGIEQQTRKMQETFSKVKVLPKIPRADLGGDLTPEQVGQSEISQSDKGSVTLPKITSIDVQPDKVVTNYATGKSSVQSHEQFNKSTFSAEREIDFEKSKLDTSHLDADAPLYHNNTNVDFTQIKGAPELHTKIGNMFVAFMRDFGKMVGKEPTAPEQYKDLTSTDPKKRWLGGISYDTTYAGLNIMNPFRSLWFNPTGISDGAMASGPKRAAMESLHTFLHEITHIPERNEGSGFTREETNNIGRISDFPQHKEFLQALEQVYTKHWKTLNEIHEQFYHPNTKNSAESFKAGARLEPESGRGKGADKGLPAEHAPEDVGLQEQGPTGTGRAGESDRKIGSLGDILTGQKSGAQPRAEPAPAEVAAPAPQPERVPTAAPVSEGVSGRGGVADIRDTLAGIKEAAAQPPETPEQRQYAPPLEVQTGEHEVRPPTPSESASPRRDMSEQEMSQTIANSLQKFHEDALTTSGTSSGGLSHNDIIDAGRNAIRHGVDPEAVAGSRAIPVDQKYTVTRAHGEDLRDMAEAAEDLARRNPSQVNKDAADAAFSDYSNWDKETVRPLRKAVEEQYPGMPPEDFNPRSMTDLRQQMIRQNNRDFSTRERVKAEERLKEVERTTQARNKELMKWDEELRKGSPELVKDIKNGDELFEYVANVMKKLFPCS